MYRSIFKNLLVILVSFQVDWKISQKYLIKVDIFKRMSVWIHLQNSIHFSYEELKDVEYRPVRVRGEFLHENIVYIGPKTKIHNGNVDLFPPPQENGYHVITPFKLENSEKRILVNRGWVPNNKLTPTSRKESVPTG